MDGIGRNLAPRPMAPCAEGSDPLTGLGPTLLLAAPPWHPLVAVIAQPAPFIPRTERLSMLHSRGYYLIRVR
jgi:hypothetical protein